MAEQDRRTSLYGEILYREARSLLAMYLPIALPQEPSSPTRFAKSFLEFES